jgi:hypothetical protein
MTVDLAAPMGWSAGEGAAASWALGDAAASGVRERNGV